MKTKRPLLQRLSLIDSALLFCALNLPAQTAPTVTNQPPSQTDLAGSNVTFNVTVDGTGPFNYQWRFNGTNLPNIITTVAGNGTGRLFRGRRSRPPTPACLTPALWPSMSWAIYISPTASPTHSQGGHQWHHHHGGRQWHTRLFGRRRHGHQRQTELPDGVALDADGNLYIADLPNNRIRKVDANGIITTVAAMARQRIRGTVARPPTPA